MNGRSSSKDSTATAPPAASDAALEMDAIRSGWIRFYAVAVARLGAAYQLVVLGLWIARRPNPYDVVIFVLWLGLVGLLLRRVALRVIGGSWCSPSAPGRW